MTADVPAPGEPVKPSGWFQLDLDALKQRYLDCWEDNNPRFDCLPRDIFDFLGFDVANLLAEVARLTEQLEDARRLLIKAKTEYVSIDELLRALGAEAAPAPAPGGDE